MTLKLKIAFVLLLVCAVLAVNVGVIFAQDTATEDAAAEEEGDVLGGIVTEEPAAEAETEVETEADAPATVDEAAETADEEGTDSVGAEPGTIDVEAAAESEPEVEATPGLKTGVLLVGLGAVLAVGLMMMARDSFKADPDADA